MSRLKQLSKHSFLIFTKINLIIITSSYISLNVWAKDEDLFQGKGLPQIPKGLCWSKN